MGNHLDRLNKDQMGAALAINGYNLTLAGPGTGKTSTLVARIVELLDRRVQLSEIACLTFTNKAAKEMAERISKATGINEAEVSKAAISTFHSLGRRMIREFSAELGRPIPRAVVSGRQQRQIIYDLGVSWSDNDGDLLAQISIWKERLLSAEAVRERLEARNVHKGDVQWAMQSIYARYEQALQASGAIDFADLVAIPVQTFRDRPDILARWARRFRYVHCDEYQDVNSIQQWLLRALSSQHGNLWVVGDDDQAIYGFRGSDSRLILGFPREFPGARVHYLKTNYRSTGRIVEAANRLISANQTRYEKNLVSSQNAGEKIDVAAFKNTAEQASWIADRILEHHERGVAWRDFAILFRQSSSASGHQVALGARGIPTQVSGALEFWDLPECRLVVGFLRLYANGPDDVQGKEYVGKSRARIWDEVRSSGRRGWAAGCERALWLVMNKAPNKFDKDRRESWDQNVEAAVDQARNAGSLDQFMQIVAQGTSSQKKTNGDRDAVTLSTCHAAKGLEWPIVFVSSVEQRHFPHHEALDVEEERRLLFVAATRAKEHLSLTYRVNDRFDVAPSMFLWDMNHQDDGLFTHLQMFEDLDACDRENAQGSNHPFGRSVIQWTEKADQLLTQRISEGESVDEIAVAFGVARREIEGRLSQLKGMPAS